MSTRTGGSIPGFMGSSGKSGSVDLTVQLTVNVRISEYLPATVTSPTRANFSFSEAPATSPAMTEMMTSLSFKLWSSSLKILYASLFSALSTSFKWNSLLALQLPFRITSNVVLLGRRISPAITFCHTTCISIKQHPPR